MSDPVLVAVALDDRDSGPIALGIAMSDLAGGRLALVHAYPYDHGMIPAPEYEATLREEATAGLERLAATLPEQLDVTLHTYASVSPAQALHAAAETLDPLAIVVGSTHRGPVGQVLPGGVGERLLHGAPCPVAIAPHGYAGEPAELTEIGVAFDDSPEARCALDAAIALARATGANGDHLHRHRADRDRARGAGPRLEHPTRLQRVAPGARRADPRVGARARAGRAARRHEAGHRPRRRRARAGIGRRRPARLRLARLRPTARSPARRRLEHARAHRLLPAPGRPAGLSAAARSRRRPAPRPLPGRMSS